MSAGLVGSSYAGSNDWYPKGAYGLDAYQGKSFNRNNLRCDKQREICYDRYGISYHATKRYFGEKDANRAYKKYGKQVFLFSPKNGVICDRRTTDLHQGKRWVNGGYSNGGSTHGPGRPSVPSVRGRQWQSAAAAAAVRRLRRLDATRPASCLHGWP